MTVHEIEKVIVMLLAATSCNMLAAGGEDGVQSAASMAVGITLVACIVVAAAFFAKRALGTCAAKKCGKGRNSANERLRAISGTLGGFAMVPHLEAESSDDAIEKLVRILREQGKIKDEAAVLESIRVRERSMPTGLDNGLAIPHGRTNAVEGLVGAVATVDNPNGIPNYETIDKSPVRIVVLSVSSESKAVEHLHLLSDISRSLGDHESRQKLLACKDAVEMSDFFSGN